MSAHFRAVMKDASINTGSVVSECCLKQGYMCCPVPLRNQSLWVHVCHTHWVDTLPMSIVGSSLRDGGT